MQVDYRAFENEVRTYRKLQRSAFALPLYAAFRGYQVLKQFGILITEIFDRTFRSYEDMSLDEKTQALDCLVQLPEAGVAHGDVSASNFGIKDGKVVIINFSNTGPCNSENHDECYEVR
ncbi:hypothetical protein AJ80_08691 [Polytolypa hystricis UAMH7299]|uniref:Protein kinase domain-containing protein n=1 Tax=Polytolypa hystricis (strain UAMH7299) TaxID=1447883 RepID=A0A2B7X3U4_POLH7|nr:hypothetical protein AJ80_08691 [Polytolypa hystricis UAMH7299]